MISGVPFRDRAGNGLPRVTLARASGPASARRVLRRGRGLRARSPRRFPRRRRERTVRPLFLQVDFECINEKKRQKKKSYKNSGVISVKQCEVSALRAAEALLPCPHRGICVLPAPGVGEQSVGNRKQSPGTSLPRLGDV